MLVSRCEDRSSAISNHCATNLIHKFEKEERSGVGWLVDAGHSGIPA